MERQQSIPLSLPKSVAVVGCGGVGSWVAYFLALSGVGELWLFDGKQIRENNLNRIPLPKNSVDKWKSQAVAELVKNIRPNCKVVSMGEFNTELLDSIHLVDNFSWIVVTTDSLASRKSISKWAANWGICYIEAAAEGEVGSTTGSPAEWATPEEEQPGYASVPVWVGPCVTSAIAAVSYVVHNHRIGERTIRMGWDDEENEFKVFDSGERNRV